MTDEIKSASRRPLKSRGNALVQRFVAALLRTSITPNQISLLSCLRRCLRPAACAATPLAVCADGAVRAVAAALQSS
jgi:hypothetical protein